MTKIVQGKKMNSSLFWFLCILLWRNSQPGSRNILVAADWSNPLTSEDMRSVLPSVAEQLFRDIEKIYLETRQSKNIMHKGIWVLC